MFDFVGVLVLIVLIALFGFLATRAWRLKNPILKWGGVILTGLLTLLPIVALVLALIGFSKLNTRYSNPVANVTMAGTPEQIARGEKLANICTGCHSPNGQLPLTGQDFLADGGLPPIGTIYGPNLTPAGELKDWSDGEVIRAIREGVHKNGRALLIMPSDFLKNMSDDDVQALVAYLRSQLAAGQASPATKLNVLGALVMNLADFRTAQAPVGRVAAPAAGVTPEYGKYMVDIAGCRSCHGEQLQGRDPNDQNGPPPGPNLTKVIPQWSEEQFITFFRAGQLPEGEQVSDVMPWKQINGLASDDELKAMYAYLHSLPPVEGPAQ